MESLRIGESLTRREGIMLRRRIDGFQATLEGISMRQFRSPVRRLVVLIAVAVFAVAPSIEAKSLKTRLQEESNSPSDQVGPVQRGPVQRGPVQRGPVQNGSPVQKGDTYCTKISYHHHCSLRKTCCCSCSTIQQILSVEDPCCCGKTIEIPVCLPDCCDDCPKVVGNCGPLGRGVTMFRWCCGYKVKVIVDRCGDIAVHSYGR